MSTTISATTISPSEIVMLRGADFAAPGRLGFGERVLGGDAKVNARDWMRAAWLAATAAAVGAGDVRLTPTTTKHLFGLVSGHSVQAEHAGGAGDWPAGSLESRLVAYVARGPADLRDVYVALINRQSEHPELIGLALARAGLLARGLVETHEHRVLGVVTSTEFAVPPATASLAGGGAVGPVQTLARTGGGIEPATWAAVGTALDRAIDVRTKRQDD